MARAWICTITNNPKVDEVDQNQSSPGMTPEVCVTLRFSAFLHGIRRQALSYKHHLIALLWGELCLFYYSHLSFGGFRVNTLCKSEASYTRAAFVTGVERSTFACINLYFIFLPSNSQLQLCSSNESHRDCGSTLVSIIHMESTRLSTVFWSPETLC